MTEQYQDQQFLDKVIKELVDNPDDVKIERKVDEMGVLLTLTVNSADMGKIIGRQGNTAKAIRTLLRVVGMKYNARVNLKINEPASPAGEVTGEVVGNERGLGVGSRSVDSMEAVMNDLKVT